MVAIHHTDVTCVSWCLKITNNPCGFSTAFFRLTHWGRVTHICVSKLTIIGSDNGLSPGRRQAIIWTNDGILFVGDLGTNFSEILIKIQTFSFKKKRLLKVSSAKWRPFHLGLNVLTLQGRNYQSFILLDLCEGSLSDWWFPAKGPAIWKLFPCLDVIVMTSKKTQSSAPVALCEVNSFPS